MSAVRSNPISVFIVFFLIISTIPPCQSFLFSSFFLYQNIFSLSHTLLTGVSKLRASRGDVAGAARARSIANKLKGGPGFGFWRILSSASISDTPNYEDVLHLLKSLSDKLVKAFGNSGLVRELVEFVQIEVVEGVLLRDCFEVGSSDLKALIQAARNLVMQFFPDSNKDPEL
ncbi:hypothetical protein Lalb_Chr18g0055041 [Lupinus albus]|uniref:Uncharacterized protein n=1 Tax=Lupinus albus TaxID=3870 RepID=A0A6A4NLP2_LUPAL|nr:hypothetical protein Lalb_Chr18g0055041 [Lupinus albus]